MQLQHFLWDFRFSDPYKAYSYDTLHSDDLGKWGKHLWELTLSILEESGAKGKLTQRYLAYLLFDHGPDLNEIFCNRMAIFPRWSNLKHFYGVTTTHFTDGQSFYDILKVCTNFWESWQRLEVAKFTLTILSAFCRVLWISFQETLF